MHWLLAKRSLQVATISVHKQGNLHSPRYYHLCKHFLSITGGGECYSLQLHHSDEAMKAFCVVSIVHNVFSKVSLNQLLRAIRETGPFFDCTITEPGGIPGKEVSRCHL